MPLKPNFAVEYERKVNRERRRHQMAFSLAELEPAAKHGYRRRTKLADKFHAAGNPVEEKLPFSERVKRREPDASRLHVVLNSLQARREK
jgi:hypothetical protein